MRQEPALQPGALQRPLRFERIRSEIPFEIRQTRVEIEGLGLTCSIDEAPSRGGFPKHHRSDPKPFLSL